MGRGLPRGRLARGAGILCVWQGERRVSRGIQNIGLMVPLEKNPSTLPMSPSPPIRISDYPLIRHHFALELSSCLPSPFFLHMGFIKCRISNSYLNFFER